MRRLYGPLAFVALAFVSLPVSAEIDCPRAVDAANEEEWQKALDALRKCEEQDILDIEERGSVRGYAVVHDVLPILQRGLASVRWLAELNRFDEARKTLADLHQSFPGARELALMNVRLLAWSKDHPAAEEALGILLESADSANGRVDIDLAVLYTVLPLWRDEVDEAISRLAYALKWHPGHIPFIVSRVRLLAGAGRFEEAAFIASDLLEAAQEDPETACLVGDVFRWQGRYEEAIVQYRNALMNRPQDRETRLALAEAYLGAGMAEEAEEEFSSLCEEDHLDRRACRVTRRLGRPDIQWFSHIQASRGYSDSLAVWKDYLLVVEREMSEEWVVGGKTEIWQRPVATTGNDFSDVLFGLHAIWEPEEGRVLSAGLSFGPDALFAPVFELWVEPQFDLTHWLNLQLRIWRQSFADNGAFVLAPGTLISFNPLWLSVRYFFSIDELHGLGNSGIIKLGWDLTPAWSVDTGVGFGDRTDFEKPRHVEMDRHFLVKGNLSWQIDPFHQLLISYIYRQEREEALDAGPEAPDWHQIQQILLGYKLKF